MIDVDQHRCWLGLLAHRTSVSQIAECGCGRTCLFLVHHQYPWHADRIRMCKRSLELCHQRPAGVSLRRDILVQVYAWQRHPHHRDQHRKRMQTTGNDTGGGPGTRSPRVSQLLASKHHLRSRSQSCVSAGHG
eukprot:1303337-Rhodomonas_salina.1